jgi:opacity protein-like surface antigen
MPVESIAQAVAQTHISEPEPQVEEEDPARGAGQAAAAATFGETEDPRAGADNSGGHEAIAQYDYEKAEENELELREGERVYNIDMVDEDWWMGENSRGEKGLFPSNYVELVEASSGSAAPPPAPAAVPAPAQETAAPPPPAPAAAPASAGKTATAQYDYEAAEDNELSFPDGGKITGIVSSS